jgi:hypothetical protein
VRKQMTCTSVDDRIIVDGEKKTTAYQEVEYKWFGQLIDTRA